MDLFEWWNTQVASKRRGTRWIASDYRLLAKVCRKAKWMGLGLREAAEQAAALLGRGRAVCESKIVFRGWWAGFKAGGWRDIPEDGGYVHERRFKR